jgi:ABC-2 type transport system permease protein
LRAALVPNVPHIEPWISLTILPAAIILLTAIGIRGFCHRAID